MGNFDINLPLTGATGIECRSGGAANDYELVVTFPNAVTFTSADVTSGIGTVSSATGNATATVTVNLTGVTTGQTITTTIHGVNDATTSADISIPMTVLVGDVTGDSKVDKNDITQTKQQVRQPVTTTNFREDVTADGKITNADMNLVKANQGTVVQQSFRHRQIRGSSHSLGTVR